MAAGEGTRWGNHLGTPKHLVPVDGEPLLQRTVRQLRERGAEVVVLGPPDRRYDVAGGYRVAPAYAQCDTDKFLSTLEWWDPLDRTLIVYGDCYLSETAVEALFVSASMMWVGRAGASEVTGCPWGELFGMTFTPLRHGDLARAIVHVRGLLLAGLIGRGGGWEVYRATQDLPLDPTEARIGRNFVEVDDWSDDFDYPEDYDRWIERRAEMCTFG